MKKILIYTAIIAVVVLILAGLFYCRQTGPFVSLEHNRQIDITPEQIRSIRDIGQWEFLSIATEELVDTTRKGFFTDDHLVRIYYGTLRLGIDLQQTREGWITTRGDTVLLQLPKIGLLDEQFIDESRTRSFHESGRWQAADREALYHRAALRMRRQALTPQNLHAAQLNGEEQVRKFMRALGFEHVSIAFQQ